MEKGSKYPTPTHLVGGFAVPRFCSDHTSPIMQQLHWLPVSERISFKILLLTYKTVNGFAPSYIEDLVNHYVSSRSLRSTSQGLLTVPRSTTSTYGDRAFLN